MKPSTFLALLFVTAFLLMWVAFYNGFPLVEGDTGAYIQQAIYPHFAADRSPFYGLFIRVTSLWTSLWWPVFAQCLILSFLLLKFITLINSKLPTPVNLSLPTAPIPNSTLLVTILAILSLTCVAWVTAFLMPDVFAGILLLSLLLFISNEGGRISQLVYAGCIFLALLMHNSHFVITLLFSLLLLVYAIVKHNRLLVRKNIAVIALCASVWTIMCSMNAIKHYGFTFSRGKDIFMMARLAETGILKTYLDDNCAKKNLALCNYKAQVPATLTDFLWSGESPLYRLGGWDSNKAEYRLIIHDVFTTPKYQAMFAASSARSTLKELTQIQAPDRIPVEDKNAEPWKKVQQYFSDQMPQFITSLQNQNKITAHGWNIAYYLFFVLSLAAILYFYKKIFTRELLFIYVCIILFLIVNAFVTATFSTVIYRFQYRVAWVLPAANAIVLIRYFAAARQKNNVENVVNK
jgi:hypothetical protein